MSYKTYGFQCSGQQAEFILPHNLVAIVETAVTFNYSSADVSVVIFILFQT